MNWFRMVPTGQCIIKNRGGGPAPAAPASMLRSRASKPKAPPMPARNERRAKRYDCISESFRADAQRLRRGDLGEQRGEAAVGAGEGVHHALHGAAGGLWSAGVGVVRAALGDFGQREVD